MSLKAFVVIAALLAVAAGFLIPTPGESEPAPVSQVQTIELGP